MNCRFRVSKYKNISCKQPDNSKLLPNVLGGKFPSGSNLIASSGYLYAFLGSNGIQVLRFCKIIFLNEFFR